MGALSLLRCCAGLEPALASAAVHVPQKWQPLPWWRAVLWGERTRVGLGTDWGACTGGPSTSQNSGSLLICHPVTSDGLPCSPQMPCQIQAGFVPHGQVFCSAVAAFALAWNCTLEQGGLEGALDMGWGPHWVVTVPVCCFCLVLGVSKCVCTLS